MADKQRRFRVEDVFAHKALSGLTATPDGRLVAFVASQPDLKGNRIPSDIWAWQEGRGAWQVTFGAKAARPLFAPRGERLAFLSDRAGGDKQQIFVMASHLSEAQITDLVTRGIITKGMLPKVDGCLAAVKAGVRKAHIIDGRIEHSLLLEIFTSRGIGTEIVLK